MKKGMKKRREKKARKKGAKKGARREEKARGAKIRLSPLQAEALLCAHHLQSGRLRTFDPTIL